MNSEHQNKLLDKFITNVSRETFSKIEQYIELLYKFNKTVNLTKVQNRHELLCNHIIACLDLREHIENHIFDVGSGNGIPGIILAILGYKVTLVEKDIRKSIALKEIIRLLGLDTIVYNNDYNSTDMSNIVLSKGLLNVLQSVQLMKSQKNIQKIILFKGTNYREELNKNIEEIKYSVNVIKSEYSDQTYFIEIKR